MVHSPGHRLRFRWSNGRNNCLPGPAGNRNIYIRIKLTKPHLKFKGNKIMSLWIVIPVLIAAALAHYIFEPSIIQVATGFSIGVLCLIAKLLEEILDHLKKVE